MYTSEQIRKAVSILKDVRGTRVVRCIDGVLITSDKEKDIEYIRQRLLSGDKSVGNTVGQVLNWK